MGHLYCVTSQVLKEDHFKVGYSNCKNKTAIEKYLCSRYGTAYGRCVEIKLLKQVGNPVLSEKLVHTSLKQYRVGGELYCCKLEVIIQAFNDIPITDEISPKLILKKKQPPVFISPIQTTDVNQKKIIADKDTIKPNEIQSLTIEKNTTQSKQPIVKQTMKYSCNKCIYTTNKKSNYNLHMQRKTDCANDKKILIIDQEKNLIKRKTEYVCEKCNYTTNKKSNFILHIERLNNCLYDNKIIVIDKETSLIKGKTKYVCEKCNYTTNKKSNFILHMQVKKDCISKNVIQNKV